jgi:hypothetical protein
MRGALEGLDAIRGVYGPAAAAAPRSAPACSAIEIVVNSHSFGLLHQIRESLAGGTLVLGSDASGYTGSMMVDTAGALQTSAAGRGRTARGFRFK